MAALLPQLAIGVMSKLFGSKKNSKHGSSIATAHSKGSSRRPGLVTSVATISILVAFVALILSILCLFAGSKPGFLEEYSIFTLNVSRIGENWKDKIDDEIRSINIKRSLRPSHLDVPIAMITAPPTTLIRVRSPLPLDLPGGSDVESIVDGAKSKASKLTDKAGDEVSSVKSAAESAVTSAADSLKAKAIAPVNEAYTKFVKSLDLSPVYNLYVETTCQGTYVNSEGKNITVGGDVKPDKGTHEHVDTCEKHGDLNPIQAARVIYIAGMILIGASLVCIILDLLVPSWHKWLSRVNKLAAGLAFVVLGMLTAVVHGLAAGASKIINFIGNEIGIEGYTGKLFNLSWAVVGLMGFYVILLVIGGRLQKRATKKASEGGIEMQKQHEFRSPTWHRRTKPSDYAAWGPARSSDRSDYSKGKLNEGLESPWCDTPRDTR